MHPSGSAKTGDGGLNQGLRTAWRRSARPRLCLLRPLAAGRGRTFARHERRAGHAEQITSISVSPRIWGGGASNNPQSCTNLFESTG